MTTPQAEAGDGLNSEAFHHLNVGLRLLGRRHDAIEETWEQICGLAAHSTPGAPRTPFHRPEPVPSPASGTALGLPTPSLTVVCVKWGDKYSASYVNKLARAVRRSLRAGAVSAFVCFTDDAWGLDETVEPRPLPRHPEWQGWWFKAHIFSREAKLTGRLLFLDLDTVVVGSLEPLRAYCGPFATLSTAGLGAEEGYTDGYNTSAMLWDAGSRDDGGGGGLGQLHDALRPEVFTCLMRWDHWVEMLVPSAHLLQEAFPGLFADYRKDCKSGPPAGAAVVCFPRFPKPHEVEDCAWIQEHWV